MASVPNILFLLTDNQRNDLLGCAGNPIIQTPNIDRLAASGVRFANAFCTSPICAASRASYLTGVYESRHRFTFLTPPLQRAFTDSSYPAALKRAGYRTGLIGKFGIAAKGIDPSLEDEGAVDKMFDVFDNYEHWTEDGYEIRQPDGRVRHLTDITGDKAIDFLRTHPNQPFCLSVSFNAPHAQDNDPRHYIWPATEDPLYADAKIPEPFNAHLDFFSRLPKFLRETESRVRWQDRYATPDDYQRNMRGLYRMVSGVDRNIGRILAALDQLSLAADTVVIFASDHGMYYGDRGLSDCWQLNEQSIRIPLIVFDPRADEGNRGVIREEMALNIDVAPTILELAGLRAADGMQGKSLVPLLGGKEVEWRKAFFCEHRFDRADIPQSEGVRTQQWKYIRYYEQQPVYEELYDLREDPHESCNLAEDPKFSDQLARLRRRCDTMSVECA